MQHAPAARHARTWLGFPMVPSAIPDLFTGTLAAGTVVAMGLSHLSPLPLMLGGAAVGLVLRGRFS